VKEMKHLVTVLWKKTTPCNQISRLFWLEVGYS